MNIPFTVLNMESPLKKMKKFDPGCWMYQLMDWDNGDQLPTL